MGQPTTQQELDAGDKCVEVGVLSSCMLCLIKCVSQPSNQQEVDAGNRCVGVGVSPPCMLPGFDRDGVNMGYLEENMNRSW